MRHWGRLGIDLGWSVLGALVVLTTLAAAASAEPDRTRTIEILSEIADSPSGFDFRARINDGRGDPIQIGETVEYHFNSARMAHLTLVHVDYHGVATVIFPNQAGLDAKLVAGEERVFPSLEEGFVLHAEPPVGSDFVLALATSESVPLSALGLTPGDGPLVVLEAAVAPEFAQRLAERYAALPAAERAAARIEQRVVGRSGATEYSSRDIVSFFNTRTRSIARPRLDLHVHFASASDVLDAAARANLDVVADALSDPTLGSKRFAVNGHTDDVGDFDFNRDLSRRRAAAVVRYLRDEGEIDAQRLEVRSFGETQPLVLETTSSARRLNRRVEFELLR